MYNHYYEDTGQLTLHPWGVSEVRDVSGQPYHNRNDRLWKAVLEDLFEDFLCFFFPDARERFDLERGFEFLDKEMDQIFHPEEEAAGVRHVDKLVKVFLKNNTEDYELFHVEVQGQKGKEDFPERMHRYWYRIKDKHGMPVTSMAILTDANRRFHPKAYVEERPRTRLTFEFGTYKLLEQDEAELRAHPHSFALVIRAALQAVKSKKTGDQQRLAIKRDLLEELIGRELDQARQRKIFEFINHIVPFKRAEAKRTFEQEIRKLTGGTTTMGIEEFLLEEAREQGHIKGRKEGRNEGRREGIEKGKAQVVENLIQQLGFSVKQAAKVAEVPVDFVRKIQAGLKPDKV